VVGGLLGGVKGGLLAGVVGGVMMAVPLENGQILPMTVPRALNGLKRMVPKRDDRAEPLSFDAASRSSRSSLLLAISSPLASPKDESKPGKLEWN
jgi:hypothetical protein